MNAPGVAVRYPLDSGRADENPESHFGPAEELAFVNVVPDVEVTCVASVNVTGSVAPGLAIDRMTNVGTTPVFVIVNLN
jgi:hypothetical protein